MKVTSASLRLMRLLLIPAILSVFINYRMNHAGQWLPPLPYNISEGGWKGSDAPLSPMVLSMLGEPRAEGRLYTNPFGEWISASVIAADSFDAYHEPTICSTTYGFYLKAEKRPLIAGPGTPVRAMLLRNERANLRIILYYWVQHEDGTTDTEKLISNYRDIVARFRTGQGLIRGRQSCLVRVFSVVQPNDVNGVQAHRNVRQMAERVYHTLNPNGRGRTGGGGGSSDAAVRTTSAGSFAAS